jgi:hypothetical protein
MPALSVLVAGRSGLERGFPSTAWRQPPAMSTVRYFDRTRHAIHPYTDDVDSRQKPTPTG